jgi:hypothetical protein
MAQCNFGEKMSLKILFYSMNSWTLSTNLKISAALTNTVYKCIHITKQMAQIILPDHNFVKNSRVQCCPGASVVTLQQGGSVATHQPGGSVVHTNQCAVITTFLQLEGIPEKCHVHKKCINGS